MCRRPLVCLIANAAILIGPAITGTSEEVWTASPVRPVEEDNGGRQETPPCFPAHTIESQLHTVIRAKIGGHWVAVGETPDTVDVPACDDMELYLGWLRASNCNKHVKEVTRLGIGRLELRSDTDSLKEYRESGLLDHVTALTVRGYDYSIRDLSDLAGLKELSELDLTPSCDLEDISALSELPQLTSLGIGGCFRVESLQPIAQLKKLRHLHLPDSPTEEQIKWLIDQGVLRQLESLAMCHPRSTDLSVLPQMDQLQSFCLWRCPVKELSFLSKMPNLQSLYLNVGASDLSPVLELTKLRSLELVSCDYVTREDLRELQQHGTLRNLRNLHLCCSRLQDVVVTDMPRITKLKLWQCKTVRNLSLSNVPELSQISLGWPHQLQSLNLDDSPRHRELILQQLPREVTGR